MLVSMTGFGAATSCENGFVVSCEIKAVNNRFMKNSFRLPDGFGSIESKIDELLRAKIVRGSVNFSMKIERETVATDFEVNFDAVKRYVDESRRFAEENPELPKFNGLGDWAEYLRLPGVIRDKSNADRENLPELLWGTIAKTVEEALEKFQVMREVEGAATQKYLADNIQMLRDSIAEVKAFAPKVVELYRERLQERIAKVMNDNGLSLDPSDLIREVAVYTDRVDISEEISRFYSHLDQFDAAMLTEKACGKKLDFLTQEMFRETNTIGSKANSPDVLKYVVEMKSTIERIRENVQNVE